MGKKGGKNILKLLTVATFIFMVFSVFLLPPKRAAMAFGFSVVFLYIAVHIYINLDLMN